MCGRTMTVLLWMLGVALVIVGLVGVVLPALPGTILVFAGLLIAAWADGFMRVGAGPLIVVGVMGAASYFVDIVAAALGARHFGASRRAAFGATLGTIAGLFFGLPGLIIGPFIGAVVGELTSHRDLVRAGRVGLAAWVGFIVGTAVKVGLAFAMVGVFAAAWLVF